MRPGRPVHYSVIVDLAGAQKFRGQMGQGSQMLARSHPWQAQQALAGVLILGEKEQRMGKYHDMLVILTPSCLDPRGHVQKSGQV